MKFVHSPVVISDVSRLGVVLVVTPAIGLVAIAQQRLDVPFRNGEGFSPTSLQVEANVRRPCKKSVGDLLASSYFRKIHGKGTRIFAYVWPLFSTDVIKLRRT